jgi:hypothetical protein
VDREEYNDNKLYGYKVLLRKLNRILKAGRTTVDVIDVIY